MEEAKIVDFSRDCESLEQGNTVVQYSVIFCSARSLTNKFTAYLTGAIQHNRSLFSIFPLSFLCLDYSYSIMSIWRQCRRCIDEVADSRSVLSSCVNE